MTAVNIDDPLYSEQWHFALLGDIETIWSEFTGEGVSVGVYDDGMDTDHVDLDDNYDASLQPDFDDGLNNSIYDGHGTSVGGIIAAENNGIGGVGVAFNATVTSIDFLVDAYIDDFVAEAIEYMSTFDIINQSYGYDPDFSFFQSLAYTYTQGYIETQQQYAAAIAGRGGLGTIMVKAAGNAANNAEAKTYGINGNAQGESSNSVHFNITVGALAEDGFVESYSSYGANLLVSAGAAQVTTDLTGTAGYEAGDYTDEFGGTSAATPVTVGVIALMLEANPELTNVDVQMILAVSAAMTGSSYGSSGAGYEVDAWVTIGDGTWNGGGMTYNPSYGYGAVDVFAAVRMAEVWHFMTDQRLMENQTTVSVQDYPYETISDNSSIDIVFDVTDGIMIDHVYVKVDIAHGSAEDLEIFLITPDGDVIELANDDGSSNAFDLSWVFGVAALRGTDSEGEWTVQINDDSAGSTGTLYEVGLDFVGYDMSNDDVWHFTDDFLDLAAVDGDRDTVGDHDGGDDTINMVAITGDVVATLGLNEAIRVDGTVWATQESDEIYSLLTGDGDDRLTGSAESDAIFAGRGNDFVSGAAGGDILAGFQGDDIIFGEERGGYGAEESAQIFRLFNSVFGRLPGQGGHQNWMNQLLSSSMTLDEVAELFISSPEFEATYGTSTNVEFVTLLFQNVLGRDPADSGLAAWVSVIEDQGVSRAEVVRRISEAAENVALTADDLETFEENSDGTVFAPRIYRLFEAIFGREPNEDGFSAWVQNFENGMTFTQAVTNFMGTAEFESAYDGTDNETFIETLFTNVLGRPPADAGLAAWVNNLETGMTREEVVEFFVDSMEFVLRTGDALFEFMESYGINDTILAGSGENIVAGGLYSDVFVFQAEDEGTTTILDWEEWDTLRFSEFGYGAAGDAIANMTQSGDDVVFEDQGTVITFQDTELEDILASQISTETLI